MFFHVFFYLGTHSNLKLLGEKSGWGVGWDLLYRKKIVCHCLAWLKLLRCSLYYILRSSSNWKTVVFIRMLLIWRLDFLLAAETKLSIFEIF